jgi:hypothetical protein
MLAALTEGCAQRGITRAAPLALQGLNDADLTFSAIQALDPYLKRRERHVYRAGFIPQPVVRFTGERDEDDQLRPGFLTSFVNTSVIKPLNSASEHADLLMAWLDTLAGLGLSRQQIAVTGSLIPWHRPPVSGLTLRVRHDALTIGDAVLLWNSKDPTFLAADLGSGLERLKWALIRQPWSDVVFGEVAGLGTARTLDALRTATLIVASGIDPAPRGAGSAVRRLIRSERDQLNGLGLSRVIRWAHGYWSTFQPLSVPWPDVCCVLEHEAFDASG